MSTDISTLLTPIDSIVPSEVSSAPEGLSEPNQDDQMVERQSKSLLNHFGIRDHFGIKGISIYFPKTYVNQKELEKISPSKIGFLAVGTETLIDKSKSVKTELMRLFKSNTDIEGVDVKNACYGGTQAVFHAIDWLEANYDTERRFAIAVLADIAVYEKGPARCTGGAGAVAVLLTPNAPLVFDKGLRACHMTSTWDFFKPVNGSRCSEYPIVNGKDSLESYMNSLDNCYKVYKQKAKKLYKQNVSLSDFGAAMFHSPFSKLVQKAIARLHAHDAKDAELSGRLGEWEALKQEPEEMWKRLADPNLEMNRRIGNMYTPSLFAQLLTFLSRENPADIPPEEKARLEFMRLCEEDRTSPDETRVLGEELFRSKKELNQDRILLFAYGSGSASAMFSMRVRRSEVEDLRRLCDVAKQAMRRLDERMEITPREYALGMEQRELFLAQSAPSAPIAASLDTFPLFPHTYCLRHIDEGYVRHYGIFRGHQAEADD